MVLLDNTLNDIQFKLLAMLRYDVTMMTAMRFKCNYFKNELL